jgi:AraC-like DNA-binding protein
MIASPKSPDLPRGHRPSWDAEEHPEISSDLLYLGWGIRMYGRYSPGDSNVGWTYVLVLKGTPKVLLADGPRRVTSKVGIVLAPRRKYKFGWQDSPDALSQVLIWLWREPPLIRELRPAWGHYHLFQIGEEGRKRLQALHAACRREVTNPDEFTATALQGIRGQIDAELARQLRMQHAKSDRHAMAEMAVRWMQQHLPHRSPIFLLCDYLQVARSTLDRLFAEVFQQSPSEYHQQLRMLKADELIKEGKRSVKEIAYELGYRHPSDFRRAFRTYQASPRMSRPKPPG